MKPASKTAFEILMFIVWLFGMCVAYRWCTGVEDRLHELETKPAPAPHKKLDLFENNQ